MSETQQQDNTGDQWRAAGRLAGHGLGSIVGIVRDTHAAVSQRVAAAAPASAEVIAAERTIATQVYDIVEAAHRVVPEVIGHAAAVAAPTSSPTATRAGGFVQAAAQGLWGDRIESEAAVLAVTMAVRQAGADVPPQPAALQRAFPVATGDLVLFVHGLAEDELAWSLTHDGDATSYAERLAEEGFAPLLVRYNSGRHISDNGRDLDLLIGELVAAWPVPVTSVSIVGHSMGGLVARSAAQQGDERGAGWPQLLRTVITLGTPHLGAPLERAAHVLDRALRLAPESAPIGRVLATRSAGIKDLRYGAMLEQDWAGQDPDEFLRDRCADVPLLPHVTYCWVSASVTGDPQHPLGHLLGDGLVRYGSASGNGHHTRTGFPMENGTHIAGASHLRLLNHPAVYTQLRGWLTAGR